MIIENKKINIKVDDNRPANYASLLLFCYEIPSQEPLYLSSIKRDLEIMNILEKNLNSETIELDDKYKESIKNTVNKTPFTIRKTSLIEFGEYINSL